MTSRALTAIDLFSGAGGLSVGLHGAGFDVRLANDSNPACARTYHRNQPDTPFFPHSVHDLTKQRALSMARLEVGELDLLVGGPPCQGFSMIGARTVGDPRNELVHQFLRLGRELRPKCMVIENVPGLATLAGGAVLKAILDGYRALGYSVAFAELLAAQYGVPQMRWRMVFVGFRRDLALAPGMGFPLPTHGKRGIGELIPHCKMTEADTKGFLRTKDAIADLPSIGAGEEVSRYDGRPKTSYQRAMRAGLSTELFNHYAPRLSPQNIARLEVLKPGQDWRDLPRKLLTESMKRAKLKDHTRRYSRMTWEGIPRSIITRFRDPKSGEYTHPEQHRTISIREAARIQSFPDAFVFEGNHSEQYDQVGNAVPPLLAKAIALEVRACLEGTATHKLENAFQRRPGLSQTQLAFAAGG
jgi:DNA (cytosine-5)-methyltransferase 1